MDLQLYLVAALCTSLSTSASVSVDFTVLVPAVPISVRQGHTTTLPCWLSPPKTAEGLEVRWYISGQFDVPVLLYRAGKIEDRSQPAPYKGRALFGLRDPKSDGLKAGDMTLQLTNVTLEDAGEYICYVSSDEAYEQVAVNLIVTEIGTPPLLSAVWIGDDLVNVSCESEGWYPKPRLRWSGQKQDLTPKSLMYNNNAFSLVSVHSWLVVSSSSGVSCSVGLTDDEEKVARMHLESHVQPQEQGSSKTGWVLFSVTLTALIAVLGGMFFKFRGKKAKSGRDRIHGDENQKLLQDASQPTSLGEASNYHVSVTLEETNNPYLKTKDGKILRDAQRDLPDGRKVTCLSSIKGTPGFSSGKHYWEVALFKEEIGLKESWWVGVTNANVSFQEQDVLSTESDGYWFLSSDREEGLKLNTAVSLPGHSRPQVLGVFVNYDSGELSFYNVGDNKLIASLAVKFTGEIFPFFNPGKGDKGPMMILQKTDQTQCSNMEIPSDLSS
ncbi:hypothetical protein LDENG_00188420 [Lucifuga dentata]|nr:hypothetical protein LDENG_00188420 [Lucifuga dentata]